MGLLTGHPDNDQSSKQLHLVCVSSNNLLLANVYVIMTKVVAVNGRVKDQSRLICFSSH